MSGAGAGAGPRCSRGGPGDRRAVRVGLERRLDGEVGRGGDAALPAEAHDGPVQRVDLEAPACGEVVVEGPVNGRVGGLEDLERPLDNLVRQRDAFRPPASVSSMTSW